MLDGVCFVGATLPECDNSVVAGSTTLPALSVGNAVVAGSGATLPELDGNSVVAGGGGDICCVNTNMC